MVSTKHNEVKGVSNACKVVFLDLIDVSWVTSRIEVGINEEYL
jgi:hypothetical protein